MHNTAKLFQEGVMPLPESWSFSQGAGVIVTGLTAYHALFGTGTIEPGDRVLIHACAGGVGLAAVQLALHAKCEIFGTCGSEEKVKLLKEKGVHHPINYRTSDFEVEVQKITKGEGVDIVIDSVGGTYFKKDIKILRANGRVVGIGASVASDRSLLKAFSLVSDVISMTTLNGIQLLLGSKSFCGVNVKQLADHKRSLLAREGRELEKLYNSGIIKSDIHTELPWTEIGKGHQMLENRQSTGKIVMIIPVEGEKEKEKEKEKKEKKVKPKKAATKEGGVTKTKRRKSNYNSYSTYIYKVLKQVHPDTGVSRKAMIVMDSFVNDIFDRLATEAGRLARYNKRHTITSREIQTAVRLILPGELAKHAVSEGTKAVTKYNSSQAASQNA